MADYLERWSQLHGNARPSGVVRGWLVVAHFLARPLVRLRISPNLLSVMGAVVAVTAWWSAPSPIAAVIILVSLIIDGLDGAVALLANRTSIWGGLVDSLSDRVAEVFWAATLVEVGADFRIVLAAWTLSIIQEYARARALTLKPEMKIVASICERPVRALVIAAGVALSAWPLVDQSLTPTVFAGVWLLLQGIGVMQVWRTSRAALRQP